jgi:AbrB family looped-hinge helix DNA binding protein
MKVTRRGQVTIPKELRKRTGIDDGNEVEFHKENGRLYITKAVADNPFMSWLGFFATPRDSDEMVKQMRGRE